MAYKILQVVDSYASYLSHIEPVLALKDVEIPP
jgi:hypothetical protein